MSANETYYVRACRDHFHVAYTDADGETCDVIPDGASSDRFPTREEAALFAARMNGELVTRAPAGDAARGASGQMQGEQKQDMANPDRGAAVREPSTVSPDAPAPSAPPRPSVEPVLSPEGEREVEQVVGLLGHALFCQARIHDGEGAVAPRVQARDDAEHDAEAAVRALVAQRERALTAGETAVHGWEVALSQLDAALARVAKAEPLVARLADGLRKAERVLNDLGDRGDDYPQRQSKARRAGNEAAALLASLDGGATEGKG